MKDLNFQRVKEIVLKDTICSFSFFWILIIIYTCGLLETTFTNVGRDYTVALPELARVYGIANRPTDGLFAVFLMITMVYTTYIKFSSKKYSKTYRLWPATALEKCTAIICEYLLIIACCYILKIIFCFGYGLREADLRMSFDTIKYMICSRPRGWGIVNNAPGPLNFDLKNMTFSCDFWPMEKIGIPYWNPSPGKAVYYSGPVHDFTFNAGYNPLVIESWNSHPALAIGLNFVDFLMATLNTLFYVALFSFIKPGKRFISAIGFKFYGIIILISVFLELFALGIGSKIPFAPLLISGSLLQGFGPWCWMSMYGWSIQAALLLIYIAIAIYYIYYKIKTI